MILILTGGLLQWRTSSSSSSSSVSTAAMSSMNLERFCRALLIACVQRLRLSSGATNLRGQGHQQSLRPKALQSCLMTNRPVVLVACCERSEPCRHALCSLDSAAILLVEPRNRLAQGQTSLVARLGTLHAFCCAEEGSTSASSPSSSSSSAASSMNWLQHARQVSKHLRHCLWIRQVCSEHCLL